MASKDCAIFYNDNAYSININKLMGRNSAGSSFLKGYFINGNPKNFWVYANQKEHAQTFANLLSKNSLRKDTKFIHWSDFPRLKLPGNLFFPGPDFNKLAWQRRFVGETAWSICGITHTTSSASVMDAIGNYYTAPIKSWDALICTSYAVKKNVEFILERKKRYLFDEIGIQTFELPNLPVIPLGINTKEFHFSNNDKNKARKLLKIDNETLVIVYIGRLSFHAKANPIAMYRAIEKAARLNPSKKIKIIECGWFSNDWIKDSFAEIANKFLFKVDRIHIDGRSQDNVKIVWQAADIFCSFSDNIQETFGISPIEAMASGLPVVISDWNGYKESVRDEVDGFKISTIMPDGGLGADLAISYAMEVDNYDTFIGKSSSFIAIDIDQATDRFDRLIKSDSLRKRLGENAKKQAVENYDWGVIIPKYEALWEELGEVRIKSSDQRNSQNKWAEHIDPFSSFSHYSSNKLGTQDGFEFFEGGVDRTIDQFMIMKELKMSSYITTVLPTENEFLRIFELLDQGIVTGKDITMEFDRLRRPFIHRSLFWLLKMGLLKLSK